MESIVQAKSEDRLIHGLDFKSPLNSSSYVTRRQEATWFSPNAVADPASSKTIRMNVTSSDGWIDLNTLVFSAVLRGTSTNSANKLQFLSNDAGILFSRLTVHCGGALVEDIQYYNKLCLMMDELQPNGKKQNDAIYSISAPLTTGLGQDGKSAEIDPGDAGERRIMWRPYLSGLCYGQSKLLPACFLGQGGLQLTWELAPGIDVCSTNVTAHSTTYTLSDIRAHADVVYLETSLQNSFAEAMLSSKPLVLHFETFVNTLHQFAKNASFDVHIARQFTRLNSIFSVFGWPAIDAANDKKDINAMYCPTNTAEQMQTFLSIGPQRWSDFDRTGPAQLFYYLQQAIGNWNATTHTLNMDFDSYRSTKHIQAYQLEKAPPSDASGENVQSGNLVTLHWKGVGNDTNTSVDKVWTFCHASVALEIRDTGCALYD